MKVLVRTVTDKAYIVEDMPPVNCLEMMAEFTEGSATTLTLEMDGATVIIARAAIVAIEFETGDGP